MKVLVVFVGLALAVAAEPLSIDYHEAFGIPETTRIKRAEQARDFDGARIVGGQVSALGQHPHLGGLLIDLDDGKQSMCASTLLSYTRLVTAAHCWRTTISQAVQFTVVLGSTSLFSGGVRRITSDVEVHAAFNPQNMNNDIAIVRIQHTPYTNVVLRALLPSGSSDYVGTWATAVGYGTINDNPSSQNGVKRHVTLRVVPNSACADVYGPSIAISSTMCVSTTGGTSICNGDDGGPLSIGSGSTIELIGVASFRPMAGCTQALPVGYTRITAFASWIRSRI